MSLEDAINRLAAAIEKQTATVGVVHAAPAAEAPAKPAKPPKAEKPEQPPKSSSPPPKETAETAAESAGSPAVSAKQMGAKIVALIQGNKRTEAVQLLKKYGAASVSEVKPEHVQAVHDEAGTLLTIGS